MRGSGAELKRCAGAYHSLAHIVLCGVLDHRFRPKQTHNLCMSACSLIVFENGADVHSCTVGATELVDVFVAELRYLTEKQGQTREAAFKQYLCQK